MSTTILNESFSIMDVANVRFFVVDRERAETLAEFVQRVRAEKRFSLSDVRRNSGLQIANSYISRIENGEVTNVTPEKLRALAKGLQVSENQIFAVARGIALEPMSPHDFHSALEALGVEQFHNFGGVEKLDAEDQQEIIAMVSAMVEQKLKRKPRSPSEKGKTKK